MLVNDNGVERVAYAEDYEDTTITLTPIEWQELKDLFEFRKQTKPCTFAKSTKSIYKKIIDAAPKLKDNLKEIK